MTIKDAFRHMTPGQESPAQHMAALTLSDTLEVGEYAPRAIYVKAANADTLTVTLKITTLGGETLTTAPLAVGVAHPIRPTQIFATGSDAGCAVWGVW